MSHQDEPATKRDLQEVKQELALIRQEFITKFDSVEERLVARIEEILRVRSDRQNCIDQELDEYFRESYEKLKGLSTVQKSRDDSDRIARRIKELNKKISDLAAKAERESTGGPTT